jgi:hypothetical protein
MTKLRLRIKQAKAAAGVAFILLKLKVINSTTYHKVVDFLTVAAFNDYEAKNQDSESKSP